MNKSSGQRLRTETNEAQELRDMKEYIKKNLVMNTLDISKFILKKNKNKSLYKSLNQFKKAKLVPKQPMALDSKHLKEQLEKKLQESVRENGRNKINKNFLSSSIDFHPKCGSGRIEIKELSLNSIHSDEGKEMKRENGINYERLLDQKNEEIEALKQEVLELKKKLTLKQQDWDIDFNHSSITKAKLIDSQSQSSSKTNSKASQIRLAKGNSIGKASSPALTQHDYLKTENSTARIDFRNTNITNHLLTTSNSVESWRTKFKLNKNTQLCLNSQTPIHTSKIMDKNIMLKFANKFQNIGETEKVANCPKNHFNTDDNTYLTNTNNSLVSGTASFVNEPHFKDYVSARSPININLINCKDEKNALTETFEAGAGKEMHNQGGLNKVCTIRKNNSVIVGNKDETFNKQKIKKMLLFSTSPDITQNKTNNAELQALPKDKSFYENRTPIKNNDLVSKLKNLKQRAQNLILTLSNNK